MYTVCRLFILLPWDVHTLDSHNEYVHKYTQMSCTELKRMECDMRIVMNAMTKQDYSTAKQEEKVVLSMEHTWNNSIQFLQYGLDESGKKRENNFVFGDGKFCESLKRNVTSDVKNHH